MAQCRELEKAVDSFKEKMAAAKANNIMTGIKHIGEISLITAQVDGMGADEMKSMADKFKCLFTGKLFSALFLSCLNISVKYVKTVVDCSVKAFFFFLDYVSDIISLFIKFRISTL